MQLLHKLEQFKTTIPNAKLCLQKLTSLQAAPHNDCSYCGEQLTTENPMLRNPFETALKNENRAIELRKLNEALKLRTQGKLQNETPASAKLAEAILRAQRAE